MNKNNFVKFFALFFTLASLSFTAAAQVMDTIAYVPVKQGYYDKISTKSKAQFGAETSSASIKSLKANSALLNIVTTTASFGKPVVVKGNIFIRPTSAQTVMRANAVELQGDAYALGVVVTTSAPLLKTVVARDVNLINRVVRLSSSSNIIVDGVSFPSPTGCSEGLEWRTVKAKNTADVLKDYTVVACKGTGSASTCTAPQADIDRCNSHGDTWNAGDCCCDGPNELVFIDATMCAGSNIICNSDNTITSAAAVCNEFAADSAECVCANGNLKQCTPKVYGAGSDEAGCVQSGEYHEACQCEYFIEFQSNYRNYACTGTPAKCPSGGGGGGSNTCPTGKTWVAEVARCCLPEEIGLDSRDGGCCIEFATCGKGGVCKCFRNNVTPCDAASEALCTDCGGTWNSNNCTCDCGFYQGNACTFNAGGCLCGTLYRACK